MADTLIDGHPAAPTSRPICYGCGLPDTDFICSHLLHPSIASLKIEESSYNQRYVNKALCDLGRDEVASPAMCRLGGHPCAQRILEIEGAAANPQLSLPESLDVLDAHWRLAFGRSKRLLAISTLTGPSALSLGCATRTEFESRLNALADVIDRLKVDDELMPTDISDDRKKGSLNRLEASLGYKLPPELQPPIRRALATLRLIHHVRNAAAHGRAEGGLTERLAQLGISDAPTKLGWHLGSHPCRDCRRAYGVQL